MNKKILHVPLLSLSCTLKKRVIHTRGPGNQADANFQVSRQAQRSLDSLGPLYDVQSPPDLVLDHHQHLSTLCEA